MSIYERQIATRSMILCCSLRGGNAALMGFLRLPAEFFVLGAFAGHKFLQLSFVEILEEAFPDGRVRIGEDLPRESPSLRHPGQKHPQAENEGREGTKVKGFFHRLVPSFVSINNRVKFIIIKCFDL